MVEGVSSAVEYVVGKKQRQVGIVRSIVDAALLIHVAIVLGKECDSMNRNRPALMATAVKWQCKFESIQPADGPGFEVDRWRFGRGEDEGRPDRPCAV